MLTVETQSSVSQTFVPWLGRQLKLYYNSIILAQVIFDIFNVESHLYSVYKAKRSTFYVLLLDIFNLWQKVAVTVPFLKVSLLTVKCYGYDKTARTLAFCFPLFFIHKSPEILRYVHTINITFSMISM